MAGRYRQIVSTPEVLAARAQYFGRVQNIPPQPERDPLTEEEAQFIARRDSFYMATVSSDGWPYVQHRGGDPGFLKVLGPNALGFADYSGNRQMLSTGNLAGRCGGRLRRRVARVHGGGGRSSGQRRARRKAAAASQPAASATATDSRP